MHNLKRVLQPLPLCVLLAATACGGSSSSPASPVLTAAVQTTTITITAAGVSPNNIDVALGARVLFINNDSRSHNMTSDPHPDHTDCPAINSVGFLQPGQQVQTGNLNTARTCGYHDHDDPFNTKFRGTINIK